MSKFPIRPILCAAAMVAPGCFLVSVSGCGGAGVLAALLPPGYVSAQGLPGGKSYDKFWASEVRWNQAEPNVASFSAKW